MARSEFEIKSCRIYNALLRVATWDEKLVGEQVSDATFETAGVVAATVAF